MATGLRIPVGVNKSGGAAIETDDSRQKQKLLTLAFSEGGDDNPFHTLGLDPGLIFSIKDAQFRGKAKLEIERILSDFEGLILLDPNEPIKFDFDTLGEVELSFQYVDLETNRPQEFRRTFNKGSGV